MKKDSKSESAEDLRQKAEELLKKKPAKTGSMLDEDQALKLIHDLEVHQIELELQNQELLLAKAQITADALRYVELYDFAPTGYYTLAKTGEIIELNLCGSQMLGRERTFLKDKMFVFFVTDDSQPIFNHFLDKVFSSKSQETCEVALQVNGSLPMYINLSGTTTENGEQCLLIAVDITNRKMAESELIEKEVQYHNLANAGIALTWTSGIDKLCNYFNETWLKFTGRTLDQEMGNGWAEGVHPDDFNRCLEIYTTSFDRREPFEMEYRLHHVSGEYRWILDIGTPNYNSFGEFIGYIGSCFDITARRQVEEALRENEEKYRLLLENTDIGIGVYSLEGRILWYNQIALQNIGGNAEDIIGKTLAEVFGEQAATVFVERIQIAATSEHSIEFEELVQLTFGDRWYLSNYSRIKDPDGEIRSVQVIAHDITKRKQTEVELLESNEMFSAFMTHSPIYTFIKEVSPFESHVLKASENYMEMIGISGSEMDGKTMYELFPNELAAKLTADDWMVVSKGGVLKVYEDFNDRNYSSIKFPITLGGKTLLAGYTIDITESKQAEEKINKLSQHFQALIEKAPDGIVLLNAEGNFKFISPAAKRIFGFQPSEEIDGNPAEYTYPDDLSKVLSALSRIVEDPSYVPTLQYRYRDKTGNWLWVESTFTNLLADPSVESILINFRNITEQKQTEEALRHSKVLLELAHQSAGAGTWNWDMTSQLLDWSNELYTMFGLDPQSAEATFNTWNTVVHPDDLEYASKCIEQAIKEKAPLNSEYRVLHPNGQVHWINALGNTTYDDFGQPMRMAGICTDITARKQAEEALHASEEQYRSLFNNFLDSVAVHQIVLDETGKPVDYIFIQVNEAFTMQTGLRMADILGKKVTEVIPGIKNTPLIDIYGKVAITGEPVIFEHFFEPFQRYFHINAFQVGEGRFCTVFQDVSDARVAEKALEESEEQFRTIFEKSVIGKSMTALDGKLQINQAFCEMLGYSKDQLTEMDWQSITYPDDVEKNQAIIKSIISGERLTARWEKRYIHQNGSIVWADISTTLQRDKEGKPLFFNTSIIDITERKRVEAELQESEKRYRSLLTNLEAGVVVHAPDTSIIMNNHRASELLGLSDDQMKGRLAIDRNWKFVDKDGIPLPVNDYPANRIVASKKPFSNVLFGVVQPGKDNIVWLIVNGFPVFNDNGEMTEVLISFIDITEKKLADEALRLKNLVFDTSIAANSISGTDGIVTEANDAFLRLWGYSAKVEVTGKSITNFLYDSNEGIAIITALVEKGVWEGDYTARKKDGTTFIAHGLATTLKDSKGEVIAYQSSVIDITERIDTEIKLKASETKFRNLIWDMQVGVLLQDPQAEIILCNPKALELLGLSEDQLLGKTSFDPHWNVIHEDGSPFPGAAHPVPQAIATCRSVRDVVMGVYHQAKGDRVWLHVNAEPQLNDDGAVAQVVCTFIDISERKLAEEALVQNRDLLANLARLVPGVIYQYRLYPDGRSAFPYASPGMNDIYEVTPEEVQEDASPVFGRLHPEDYNHVVEVIQESARTLNTFYCEYRVNLPRQGIRWRLSQAQPLRLDDGSILWHGIISDITERKLVNEALIESERKFRETVTNLDEGYYSVTMDGELLEHNQALCRILGFDPTSDLKGVHLPDFWQHPDERKEYLNALSTNSSISNYLINIKTKTGAGKAILASAHLVKDKDDQVLRIEGVFLDITDRIRMEESLLRHTERIQNLHKIDKAILSGVETPEAIIQKTLQHIRSILSSQHASIGMFDFEKEILQLFCSNIKDESIDVAKKYLINNAIGDLEILREKKMDVVENISLGSLPPDLQRIFQSEGIMSCINVPLISGEKLIGVMNFGWVDPRAFTPEELEIASEVADEITVAIEQVGLRQAAKHYAEELEKRVEERTSQLLAANKELEAFSYSVSHDLRAPLRHINGYISILSKHLKDILPEKEKHYFDTIADSAHQMGKLIDDLLHFSRTGRQEMQLTSLDMHVVLKDALQVVQHESFGRGIKWVVADLPRVTGDYALLRLVWLNLLSNAVKFCSPNVIPQIEIGVIDDNNEFVFFVRDNGVGFDMQYAHKLFGVFERLHSAQEFEGTGIGLANVRRIIQRHGGRTWAEAEVGKGATFYFSLPKG